jgi:coenzyme F420 hydrogenase subunit beta
MNKKVIISTACTGCGNCIVACPGNGLMGIDSLGGLGPRGKAALILEEGGGVFLDEKVCLRSDTRACKECHDVCPMNAVSYPENFSFYVLDEAVISKGLCSGCGACIAVCPENVIEIDEFPILNGECTNCGYCLAHCPRYLYSPTSFPTMMWDADILGRVKEKWAAKSKVAIPGAQDGGFVMALLKHLLDKEIIDAALIVTSSEKEPWRAEALLASDVDSLYRGAGSKYSNSSILSLLKEARDKGIKRIAVVGLPCQIEGLMKLYTSPNEELRFCKIIALSIGLFCKGNFLYEGLRGIIENYVPIKEVEKLDIKGKNLNITAKGKTFKAPMAELLKYKREGCKSCSDLTSKFSDFSVGSVGSPESYSTVLARSTVAQRILREMIAEGSIEVQPIDESGMQLITKLAKIKKMEAFQGSDHLKYSKNKEARPRPSLTGL